MISIGTILASNQITVTSANDGKDGKDGKDGQMLYAICSTTSKVRHKEATLDPENTSLTLNTGTTVSVKFEYENIVSSPTLNIAGTGAKSIFVNGGDMASDEYYWGPNAMVTFVYDGEHWTVSDSAALSKASEAAKTATNFLSYGENGLEIGNKIGGNWTGYRAQIKPESFNILDKNENELATYGANDIYLGTNREDTVIHLCNDKAQIKYDVFETGSVYDQMIISSNYVHITGTDGAGLDTTERIEHDDGTVDTYSAAVSLSKINGVGMTVEQSTGSYKNRLSTSILLNPNYMFIDSTGSILITSPETTVDGVLTTTGNATIGGVLNVKNGMIELSSGLVNNSECGYIDFHYNKTSADYTSRIIEDAQGKLSITASNGLYVNGSKVRTTADTPAIKTGTWTASLNGGSITKQICTYQKIGNMCTISFFIQGTGSSATGTTNFYINGAPYTPNASANWYGGGGHVQGLYDTASYPVTGCIIQSSNKRIYFRTAQVGGTGSGYVRINNGGATFYLSGTITYPIA